MSIKKPTAIQIGCPPSQVEIDVRWYNYDHAVWMAVDRVQIINNLPVQPPQPVQLRCPTKGYHYPLKDPNPVVVGDTVVVGDMYQYIVRNWDGQLKEILPHMLSNQLFVGNCGLLASTAFIQKYPAIFEVLVPFGAVINDFTHEEGSILKGLWQHVHQLHLPNNDARIQAETVNLMQGISGNLEAVARLSPPVGAGTDYLVAYELYSQGDWKGPVNLVADNKPIDHVTGSTALIQSTYDYQGHYELLVPRGDVIDHYIHEIGSILEGQWKHIHTLTPPINDAQAQFKAVVLMQSSSGMLEAIARVTPSQGSDYLVAYELRPAFYPVDETEETVSVSESVTVSDSEETESVTVSISEPVPHPVVYAWLGPVKLIADSGPIDHVTGGAALIQSNRGEFELLVPRGTVIDHYTHTTETILEGSWTHVHTLKSPDSNTQITANWLIQSRSGTFEAIARVSPPVGNDYVVGYESIPGDEWQGPVQLVANDGPIEIGKPAARLPAF